ncbi:MAG: diguanylate cyclase [Lachnospiraceae bacterium]|nr:diguanylate cyclase [Lachnospiraceae bacterium]
MAMAVISLVIFSAIAFIGYGKCPVQRIDDLKATIYHPNGAIEQGLQINKWIVKGGDRIVIRIYLLGQIESLSDDDWYAIAYLDLDRLKEANDGYGHKLGDMLSKKAASVIAYACEGNPDGFGRWGGDELLVIFHNNEALADFRRRFREELNHELNKSYALKLRHIYRYYIALQSKSLCHIISQPDVE